MHGLSLAAAAATKKMVLVVAAALIDDQGQVLLAQRPPGKALAGLWEFPGGKVSCHGREAVAATRSHAVLIKRTWACSQGIESAGSCATVALHLERVRVSHHILLSMCSC